ncbi:MAG TPA: thioredoxin domain-containing protein [Candidatus Paceibacterota bacterium]
MPEEKKHRKLPSIELTPSVSIIIAGVIIAGAIIFANQHSAPVAAAVAAAPDAAASAHVAMPSASDHIIGSPSAPIVLVEYSDFQCPYCQMIYPSIKQIVQQSNGQVAWVMREFPLYQIHPNAMPAADAAECIAEQKGNDAFWTFADDDFANQSSIGPAFFSAEAQKLGVNMATYNSCVSTHKYASKIQAETADAENSGGNGTPFTIIINTKTGKQTPLSGALPYAQIMAAIKAAQ